MGEEYLDREVLSGIDEVVQVGAPAVPPIQHVVGVQPFGVGAAGRRSGRVGGARGCGIACR